MRRVRKRTTVQTDVLKLIVRRELPQFFARRHTCAIQNMLGQERMRLGSMQHSLSWLDMNALIRGVVESLHPLLERHTIRLHLTHVMPLIRGDRDKLAQVITYLCHNAMEYAPHHSAIDIESYVKGARVHVRIQCQGSSIPSNVIAHLFEQDEHSHIELASTRSSTTPRWAAVRHIVQMHGGQLWTERISDEGRIFHLTLAITK